MSQSPKTVTIFGGSGFVGRYIVRRMAKDGWLIAKRLCNFPAKICASPDFVKKFGMPTWNFNKYLFDKDHNFVAKFESAVEPMELLSHV